MHGFVIVALMQPKLSVNLNKIALIRNSRAGNFPDILHFARLALENGAHGITIHPRPDQRHARYEDIAALKKLLEEWPKAELNVEGFPDTRLLDEIFRYQPHQFTMVPDASNQLTSDHGWDLNTQSHLVASVLERLKQAGVRSSLFLDPDPGQVKLAKELGADRIELYTGPYAKAFVDGRPTNPDLLFNYISTAQDARHQCLGVNAGHDLNLKNLEWFVDKVRPDEVSIGHALTVEALEIGFATVIQRYCQILEKFPLLKIRTAPTI